MNDSDNSQVYQAESAAPGSAVITKKKIVLGLAALGVAGAVSWASWLALSGSGNSGVSPVANAFAGSSAGPDRQVASINGVTITEMELGGLLQAGVDKAIVVDRYINKVIAAEMGKKLYQQESESLVRAAEREVLATFYTNKRLEELRKAVSAEDIKSFYGKNVLDDNYKQWRVSYYLTTDGKDMEQTLQKMKEGDRDALKQLKPLAEQGDQFARVDVEVDVAQGVEVAELLADVADLDAHGASRDRTGRSGGRSAAAFISRSCFHSATDLITSVTRASRASSEATAKAATDWYSL